MWGGGVDALVSMAIPAARHDAARHGPYTHQARGLCVGVRGGRFGGGGGGGGGGGCGRRGRGRGRQLGRLYGAGQGRAGCPSYRVTTMPGRAVRWGPIHTWTHSPPVHLRWMPPFEITSSIFSAQCSAVRVRGLDHLILARRARAIREMTHIPVRGSHVASTLPRTCLMMVSSTAQG
jgi:hypothetical protein